ncbi:MAG: hypothetical protein ACTIIT_13900 [Brevibacterium linens]
MSDMQEWIKDRRRIHAKGSTGYWASAEKNWDEPYDTTLVYDVFHNGDTMDRDHVADASYDNATAIVDAHNNLLALLTAAENVLEVISKIDREHSKAPGENAYADGMCDAAYMFDTALSEAIEGASDE